jgi:hypothetical protein
MKNSQSEQREHDFLAISRKAVKRNSKRSGCPVARRLTNVQVESIKPLKMGR